MIGPAYRSIAAQAVLGPERSPLVPHLLWLGWLDAAGDLLGMAPLPITHDVFAPTEDGVTTIETIDGGTAAASWEICGIGFFDAATAGDLVVSVVLDDPVSTSPGQALSIEPGGVAFSIVDGPQ